MPRKIEWSASNRRTWLPLARLIIVDGCWGQKFSKIQMSALFPAFSRLSHEQQFYNSAKTVVVNLQVLKAVTLRVPTDLLRTRLCRNNCSLCTSWNIAGFGIHKQGGHLTIWSGVNRDNVFERSDCFWLLNPCFRFKALRELFYK